MLEYSAYQSNLVSFNYYIRKYPDKNRIKALYDSEVEIMIKDDAIKIKSKQPLHPGFNKLCGLRGCRLSGGQKQRVAIARALIRNPKILILDEATSALDYESERVIQSNMAAICKGRTVLIIAHRLTAVRHADRILVLEQGRLVEQGRHDELIRRQDGFYHRLHSMQAA